MSRLTLLSLIPYRSASFRFDLLPAVKAAMSRSMSAASLSRSPIRH